MLKKLLWVIADRDDAHFLVAEATKRNKTLFY